MRTRFGLFVGLSAGYYLGAKAGRQRYEQLNRLITKARKSKTMDVAQDKAKAVADVAAERAKDAATSAKEKAQNRGDHNNDADFTANGQSTKYSPT